MYRGFRDGRPWPESIVDGVRLGEEAGYMPVNARTAWDAGAILGYCTDTTYDPTAGLAVEHVSRASGSMLSETRRPIPCGIVQHGFLRSPRIAAIITDTFPSPKWRLYAPVKDRSL